MTEGRVTVGVFECGHTFYAYWPAADRPRHNDQWAEYSNADPFTKRWALCINHRHLPTLYEYRVVPDTSEQCRKVLAEVEAGTAVPLRSASMVWCIRPDEPWTWVGSRLDASPVPREGSLHRLG